MGNRSSGMTSEMPAMSYAPTPREGNVYEPGFPPPPTLSSAPVPTSSSPSSSPAPPTPPRGLERRTMTTVARDRHRDYSVGSILHWGSIASHTHPRPRKSLVTLQSSSCCLVSVPDLKPTPARIAFKRYTRRMRSGDETSCCRSRIGQSDLPRMYPLSWNSKYVVVRCQRPVMQPHYTIMVTTWWLEWN